MPTSTPNIGLTLPIGTEKVSRAIINQNMTKIDTAFGNMTRATMRPVPFDVAVSDWSGSGSSWTATFVTAFVTSTSQEILTYTSSIKTAKAEDLDAMKQPGGGGIVFTSTKKPIGTISGTIYVWDTDDGKIPVIIEGTVTPIENGGTNASNLTGAKQNLGISALETNVQNLSEQIGNLITGQYSGKITYNSTTNDFETVKSFQVPANCIFVCYIESVWSVSNVTGTRILLDNRLIAIDTTNTDGAVSGCGFTGSSARTVSLQTRHAAAGANDTYYSYGYIKVG